MERKANWRRIRTYHSTYCKRACSSHPWFDPGWSWTFWCRWILRLSAARSFRNRPGPPRESRASQRTQKRSRLKQRRFQRAKLISRSLISCITDWFGDFNAPVDEVFEYVRTSESGRIVGGRVPPDGGRIQIGPVVQQVLDQIHSVSVRWKLRLFWYG